MTAKLSDIYRFFNDRWKRHAIFWAAYILIMTFIHGSGVGHGKYLPWFLNYLTELPVLAGLSYVFSYLLIDNLLRFKYYVLFFWLAIISLLFFSFLNVLLDYYLIRPLYFREALSSEGLSAKTVLINAFGLVFPVVIFVFLRYAKKVYHSKTTKTRIDRQKVISELELLRNQVHPLFLRNALQKLYILSRQKQSDLPELVLSVSDILNYMIFECDREYVRVERELAILGQYLEFEKAYAGKDFNYQLLVHENAQDYLISPYILFPLIRGFGAYHGNEDAIVLTVNISILNGRFHVLLIKEILHAPESISDTAWHSETELARRRLDLVYMHKYSLNIQEKGRQVQMELFIDGNGS